MDMDGEGRVFNSIRYGGRPDVEGRYGEKDRGVDVMDDRG